MPCSTLKTATTTFPFRETPATLILPHLPRLVGSGPPSTAEEMEATALTLYYPPSAAARRSPATRTGAPIRFRCSCTEPLHFRAARSPASRALPAPLPVRSVFLVLAPKKKKEWLHFPTNLLVPRYGWGI
jgi:hypothetical protein